MVWGAVSYEGKLPLKFVEEGSKINTAYYQNEILDNFLKNNADLLYPDGDWTFQQDSAPAHKANSTQKWLEENCPRFINQNEWPSSSPDLNPLDYCVWGILENRVNSFSHKSIESLKRKLVMEWDNFPMETIRASIESWRSRLSKVAEKNGGRFE